MERPQFLSSLLSWLRAGYPDGVPYSDYPPLLVLLRRERLTDDEVTYVADELARAASEPPRDASISRIDAGVQITKVIDELPQDEDVRRVAAHLAAHGWPFDNRPLPPHSAT